MTMLKYVLAPIAVVSANSEHLDEIIEAVKNLNSAEEEIQLIEYQLLQAEEEISEKSEYSEYQTAEEEISGKQQRKEKHLKSRTINQSFLEKVEEEIQRDRKEKLEKFEKMKQNVTRQKENINKLIDTFSLEKLKEDVKEFNIIPQDVLKNSTPSKIVKELVTLLEEKAEKAAEEAKAKAEILKEIVNSWLGSIIDETNENSWKPVANKIRKITGKEEEPDFENISDFKNWLSISDNFAEVMKHSNEIQNKTSYLLSALVGFVTGVSLTLIIVYLFYRMYFVEEEPEEIVSEPEKDGQSGWFL